jgi:hypothetical protein
VTTSDDSSTHEPDPTPPPAPEPDPLDTSPFEPPTFDDIETSLPPGVDLEL